MMGSVFRTIICTVFLFFVWVAAVCGFAIYTNYYTLDPQANADGIVVLTGGSGRVEYGLELLSTRRGKALFISGVGKEVPLEDLLEKAPEATRTRLASLLPGRITLGREAANTIGNAQESADWIISHHYRSVLLVTADYHMPRALIEFKTLLPDNVVLVPAPVGTRDYSDLSWALDAETRNLILSEFHKLIAAKLRHMMLQNGSI